LQVPDLAGTGLLAPLPPYGRRPLLTIAQRPGDGRPAPPASLGEADAVIPLDGGSHAVVERDGLRATLVSPQPWPAQLLVHPFLAGPAMAVTWWEGRESLHGGAFVAGGAAWALVADKGSGKSTTLAWLARDGIEVLADDLVVIGDGRALPGPRCIDVPLPAAERFGLCGDGRSARTAKRRMTLPPVGDAPLAGLVHLSWGDRVEVCRVGVAERLGRLAPHRGVRLAPRDPRVLVDLAALPALELRRPRGLDSVPAAAEALLAAVG
jgi:hypothetical protein